MNKRRSRRVDRDEAHIYKLRRELQDKYQDDRDDLSDGLDLAPDVGGDDLALACREKSHRRDRELPKQHDYNQHAVAQPALQKAEQNREHKYFVRQRVAELPEIRHEVSASRDFSVEHIRQARRSEKRRRREIVKRKVY